MRIIKLAVIAALVLVSACKKDENSSANSTSLGGDGNLSTTIEMVTDYIPDLIVDPQIGINYDRNEHALAQAFRKYPVIIYEDGQYKMKPFEWGIIADYMNTPEKIKKTRNSMCNARSEKVIGDKKSIWNRLRKKRCLVPMTGVFEHREVKGFKNKILA